MMEEVKNAFINTLYRELELALDIFDNKKKNGERIKYSEDSLMFLGKLGIEVKDNFLGKKKVIDSLKDYIKEAKKLPAESFSKYDKRLGLDTSVKFIEVEPYKRVRMKNAENKEGALVVKAKEYKDGRVRMKDSQFKHSIRSLIETNKLFSSLFPKKENKNAKSVRLLELLNN